MGSKIIDLPIVEHDIMTHAEKYLGRRCLMSGTRNLKLNSLLHSEKISYT